MNYSLVTRLSSLVTLLALLATPAAAAPAVTDVSARQHWPWNSLVDIDFTISGAEEIEAFSVDVSATAENGARTFRAKSFATEPIATNGANRVVWDFGADYPDTKVDDLLVTVTATSYADSTPVYMVVDLSGGASATSYPVRYTTTAPTMTVGQEDPCKTTELWLRRIKAKNVSAQLGGSERYDGYYYGPYTCTFTNDYYIGIFPLTQEQVFNIKGERYSYFTNATCRATRPMDAVNFNTVRSSTLNFPPSSSKKTGDTILQRLEERSGLPFDLPTENQWEYAMRAGSSSSAMYPGGTTISRSTANWDSYTTLPEPRNAEANTGTCYVDYGAPNAWGIYLVYNQMNEWCLNRRMTITAGETCYDKGTAPVSTGGNTTQYQTRGFRSGSNWQYDGLHVYRSAPGGTYSSGVKNYTSVRYGARVCLTIP